MKCRWDNEGGEQEKRGQISICFSCSEYAVALATFFLIFVIQENLLENETEHNGKAEQVVLYNKIESQFPDCVNEVYKDETVQKQGVLVLGPE